MIIGGEHNIITSVIHYNWVVKGLYLNGKGDGNYNQRREKIPPELLEHLNKLSIAERKG